jgi:hypothetical protein
VSLFVLSPEIEDRDEVKTFWRFFSPKHVDFEFFKFIDLVCWYQNTIFIHCHPVLLLKFDISETIIPKVPIYVHGTWA